MSQQQHEPTKARIDWPAVFAGAGAAVTVGVILSTLGAAGTLVGAALGSVVATVCTALYKQGIQTSRRKMTEVQATALQRVGMAQQEVRRAAASSDSSTVASGLARADAHLAGASSDLTDTEADAEQPAAPAPLSVDPEPPAAHAAARRGLTSLPWRRVALLTATVFVVAMLAISAFEIIAGRSVATLTGGSHDKRTSVTGLFGDTTGGRSTPTPTPPVATVTVTATPTPTPSAEPTSPPTSAPTGTDSATAPASPSDTSTSSSPVATETGTPAP